jgi:hypothetical protein
MALVGGVGGARHAPPQDDVVRTGELIDVHIENRDRPDIAASSRWSQASLLPRPMIAAIPHQSQLPWQNVSRRTASRPPGAVRSAAASRTRSRAGRPYISPAAPRRA